MRVIRATECPARRPPQPRLAGTLRDRVFARLRGGRGGAALRQRACQRRSGAGRVAAGTGGSARRLK